jgi:RNA polymerase sigma factor (sigma-70 family)
MSDAQLGRVLRYIRNLAVTGEAVGASDQELLRRFCSGGEETAFAALMRRHGQLVWRICRQVLGHEQDSEDAFQATFLVLAQKAASIRKGEALASFLHGTAYRIALAAKRNAATRRFHERQGNKMPRQKTISEETLREGMKILHEEVQNLPDQYRAVFVFRYVEGKSLAEIAAHLGCKEGTVSSALTRARRQLQQRLSRRGIELAAALCAVGLVQEKVSAMLVQSTWKAAITYVAGEGTSSGIISPAVAALVEGATKTMMTMKLKTATALVLAVSLCATAAGVFTHRALATRQVEVAQPAQKEQRSAAVPSRAEDKDSMQVSGQVLDVEGKPLAGARLYLRSDFLDADLPVRATSDAEGRFRFEVSRADRIDPQSKDPKSAWEVLAVAPGYGPDWVKLPEDKPAGELTFRLAKDDVPITGRVFDLDGNPVAGAKVSIRSVYAPEGDLTRVLEEVRAGRNVEHQGLRYWSGRLPGQPKTLTTNADGRFRLTGIGRERLVELNVTADAIQHWYLTAMTRAGKDVGGEQGGQRIYGSSFDYLARPSRPIVGTVRERETGKPVAGVWIHGLGSLERVVTDAKGHYELPGCPKGAEYHVMAAPKDDQPFFNADKVVADQPGLAPITADLQLTRGILVRGKVAVKKTGKRVRGSVVYLPLYPNGNVRADGPMATSDKRVAIRADGTFTIVVLPGPGMLGVMAKNAEEYMPASVDTQPFYDEIFKKQGNFRGSRIVVHVQRGPGVFTGGVAQDSFQAIELINPDKAGAKLTRDLVVEPITRLPGTILGPDGQPLTGVRVRGLKRVGTWEPRLPTADFTVTGAHSDRPPRNLDFVHEEKRLAASLEVKGNEKQLTVRMKPWATVTGQLVDADGKPWAGVELRGYTDAAPFTELSIHYRTDKDGRFRAEGFVPGLKYKLSFTVLDNGRFIGNGWVFEGLSLENGETKELGKIAVKISVPN